MPFYAEECASMLAVTFSGGDKMLRSIVSASQVSPPCPCAHSGSSSLAGPCLKGRAAGQLELRTLTQSACMVFQFQILKWKVYFTTGTTKCHTDYRTFHCLPSVESGL